MGGHDRTGEGSRAYGRAGEHMRGQERVGEHMGKPSYQNRDSFVALST